MSFKNVKVKQNGEIVIDDATDLANVIVKQNGDVTVSTFAGGGTPGCDIVLDSSYAMTILADNPVYYFQCQDTGMPLLDSGSAGIDIDQYVGGTGPLRFRAPGVLTSACDKSLAADSAVRFYYEGPIVSATDNFSFEFWFYNYTNAGIWTPWEINQAAGFPGHGWQLQHDNLDHLKVIVNGSNSQLRTTVLPHDDWCYFVCVRDAGVWKYYVNGSLQVSNANFGTSTPGAITGDGHIGSPSFRNIDRARMEHLAYYTYVLSPTQIATHFAAR